MKTITTALAVTLLLSGVILAQRPPEIPAELQALRADMFGALTGDWERFERGMKTLEGMLAKNPKDPALKVMWGSGLFARSGEAFRKGDMGNAMKLWQSGLAENGSGCRNGSREHPGASSPGRHSDIGFEGHSPGNGEAPPRVSCQRF